MALTTRGDGTGGIYLVGAAWWNDYKDLLTGVMTDQAVELNYRPGSGTTPTLLLDGDGHGPLLKGFKTDHSTQAFAIDSSGNLAVAGNVTPTGTLFPKTTSLSSGVFVGGIDFGNGAAVGVYGSASLDLQMFSSGNTLVKGGQVVLQGTGGNIVDFQTGGGTSKAHLTSGGALTLSSSLAIAGAISGATTIGASGAITGGSLVLSGSITGATTGAFSSNVTVGGTLQVTGNLQDSGGAHNYPIMVATVGTVGRQIFVGTSTPGSPNEGDVWVKA